MKPGVQKPHCSPWHSANACCTGLIASGSLPMPSTVVISWACAVTANIRQERIGWPSTSTVHAPQTPCSQPTWVPVRAQVVAQEVGEQPPGRCLRGALDTVDPQPDVEHLLGGRLAAAAAAGSCGSLLGAVTGARRARAG